MKKIHFNEYYVIHFFENTNFSGLWYSDREINSFKILARKEISDLLNIHKSMTYMQCVKLLYQPGNICYDENNFN